MKLSELRLNKRLAWNNMNVLPGDCGWYCDGHLLLKSDSVKKPKKYMLVSSHDDGGNVGLIAQVPRVRVDSAQRMVNGKTAADGISWFIDDDVVENRVALRDVVMLKSPDYPFVAPILLDAHKVKLISQCVGCVEYRVTDRNDPVILVKDGEFIGLLMPLRS